MRVRLHPEARAELRDARKWFSSDKRVFNPIAHLRPGSYLYGSARRRVPAEALPRAPAHCSPLTAYCSVILRAVVSYSMMMTTKTGLLRGATIELESGVPEMDGQRVRVVLEPVEEQQLSAQQQREFWQAWVERGPEGPIEDGIDTDIP
jgi:hypothetical protein